MKTLKFRTRSGEVFTFEDVDLFCGVDMNGREVYEGDEFWRYDYEEEPIECPENGKLRTAAIDMQSLILNDYYCILKEGNHEDD